MLARLIEVSPGGADAAVALTFQRVNVPDTYDAAFLTAEETITAVLEMLRSLPQDDRERAVVAARRDLDEFIAERFCASLRPPGSPNIRARPGTTPTEHNTYSPEA